MIHRAEREPDQPEPVRFFRRGPVKRLVLTLAAGFLCQAGPGAAQDAPLSWGPPVAVRAGDAASIQAVIEEQLEAFARGDDPAAYAATAPNIRRRFPTAAAFGAMVRADFLPLRQAERTAFGTVKGSGATDIQAETWSQSVDIFTHDGERWTAVYGLERQPDGSIAITSCVLVRHADTAS